MPSLVDYALASLLAELTAAGSRPVHAKRILRSFYDGHGQPGWDTAALGKLTCEHLAGYSRRAVVTTRRVSADGTTKLLLSFDSPGTAECVLMPGYRLGVAAGCVSSQIGCAMGCDFCASTAAGLERSLDAGEIVEQFLHLSAQAAAVGRKLKTLVFMGMGEPLLNFDAVVAAIGRIASPHLGALGGKQITVSTVGIVPGIDRLAAAGLNVHLALSLHAPDDATRARLIPINRRYAVADVLAAARRFQAATRRIVTIEYTLLDGVNDTDAQAVLLAQHLAGFRAHVDLIPYNTIGPGLSGVTYRRPAPPRVLRFLTVLRDAGVVAHLRDTRGDDVAAACGQLRRTALAVVPA